ncbi:LamG domain-containing protein, partial [Patescibacteria group bacterium]|nr:LamG domain-containing protein [Patescibacteria group bacterium]
TGTYSASGACSPPTALSNWWKMEDSGSTITDAIGGANGTVSTAPVCGFPASNPGSSGLVSYWKMDETSGPMVPDALNINNGTTSSSISCTFPNNNPSSSGLISYWKMNEASGQTASDSAGINNGTATGTTITTGKPGLGNARNFNGSTDYVAVTNESNFDFEYTQSFSLSVWVKYNGSGVYRNIFSKALSTSPYTGYTLRIDQDNGFGLVLIRQDSNYIWAHSTSSFNDGNWHFITATYNGNGQAGGVNLYLDGQPKTVLNYSAGTIGSILNNVNLTIGGAGAGAPAFSGSIDEAAVWNRALSTSEIQALYNGTGGGAGETPSCNAIYPAVIAGKPGLGNARNFNGSTDSIRATDSSLPTGNNPMSLTTWFKTSTSLSPNSYAIAASYGTASSAQSIYFGLGNDASTGPNHLYVGPYGNAVGTTTSPNDGQWHFGVATFDGTTWRLYLDGQLNNSKAMSDNIIKNGTLYIGSSNIGYPWNGSLDEVSVWNKALSLSEVQALYNGPETYSCASPSSSSTNGRIGQARNFSSGAYVGIPNTASINVGNIKTVGAWVKTNPIAGNQIVFSTWDNSNGYLLYINSAGKAVVSNGTATAVSSATAADGSWHYVAGVWDGTNGKIYVDSNAAVSTAMTINSSTGTNQIGTSFSGAIDEVRLYNRALSATDLAAEAGPGVVPSPVSSSCGTCGGGTSCGAGSQTCYDAYCQSFSQSCIIGGGGLTISGSIMNAPAAITINTNPGNYSATGQHSYSLIVPGNTTYTLSAPSGYTPVNPQVAVACDNVTGPTFWNSIGDAGVVGSSGTINYGSGGISQAGSQIPGYNLQNYNNQAPTDQITYNALLGSVLTNAAVALSDLNSACTANPSTGTVVGHGIDFYCYGSNLDSLLTSVLGGSDNNKIIFYPSPGYGDGPQTIGTHSANGKDAIVFVNGNLTVAGNIIVDHASQTAGIVFILQDNPISNLSINSTVTNLSGIYIFKGSFNDNADNGSVTSQLSGYGSLINTGSVTLTPGRAPTGGAAGWSWTYEPKYLTLFRNVLTVTQYTWTELPPQ